MKGTIGRMHALAAAAVLIAGPATGQAPLEVRPGAVAVDGGLIQPGTWQVRYVRIAGGREQDLGVMHHELDVIRKDGELLLRSVQTMRSARGSGVDTAIVVRGSLHPRIHRSHHGGSTLSLDFADGWVSGRATKAGEDVVDRRHALEAPVFDANILEIVLGALPLANGLHVRIPTYVFEKQGTAWFEARVAGVENVTIDGVAAPAWAVAVTFDQGSGTFYIDRASRQFVKGVIRSSDGAELRMIRTAASPSDR